MPRRRHLHIIFTLSRLYVTTSIIVDVAIINALLSRASRYALLRLLRHAKRTRMPVYLHAAPLFRCRPYIRALFTPSATSRHVPEFYYFAATMSRPATAFMPPLTRCLRYAARPAVHAILMPMPAFNYYYDAAINTRRVPCHARYFRARLFRHYDYARNTRPAPPRFNYAS